MDWDDIESYADMTATADGQDRFPFDFITREYAKSIIEKGHDVELATEFQGLTQDDYARIIKVDKDTRWFEAAVERYQDTYMQTVIDNVVRDCQDILGLDVDGEPYHKEMAGKRYVWRRHPDVAWYVSGYGPGMDSVQVTMVGDDREYGVAVDELTEIGEDEYCIGCGAIGVTHTGGGE